MTIQTHTRIGTLVRGAFVAGLVALALGALVFAGTAAVVEPASVQDHAAIPAGALTRGQTRGQTFVFRAPRLSAIQVRWAVADDFAFAPQSRVTFHLRAPASAFDLATVSLPLDQIRHNDFATFEFTPIPDSQDRAYSFFLDAEQAEITRGWFSVWASDADALPDGALTINGEPAGNDLVMRAYFAPDGALAWAALRDTLGREPLAAGITVLIWLVPGLALLWLAGDLGKHPLGETVARASGLSLAALSAASLVTLGWGSGAYLGLLALSGGALILRARARPAPVNRVRATAPDWVLLALATLALAISFIQLWNLPAPLWVDSPTHAAYIKTFLDSGRLPLASIYHLGYHSIVALLVQLSGASIPQAMILVGQLLVTQTGLTTFLLCQRLTGSAVAGVISASVIWFLCPTPTYFVTWGRYPLLLGAALLPLALLAASEWIESPRFNARAFFFAALTFVGLAFAHIRLVAFYAVFVALDFGFASWRVRRGATFARRVFGLAGIALLVGAIWLGVLFGNQISVEAILAFNAGAPQIDLATALAVMRSYWGDWVAALAAIGGGVALIRKSASGWRLLIGSALLGGIACGASEWIAPSFLVLMAFLPMAIWIGDLASRLTFKRAILVLGVLVSLAGAREMLTIVNPATILYTRADAAAADWLARNTPGEARVLVNSFLWYGASYLPADGGGWLPYTAQRAIEFLDATSAPAQVDADALAPWLAARGITHIYLGQRAGILRVENFARQPERYTLVYDRAGIKIFRVRNAD